MEIEVLKGLTHQGLYKKLEYDFLVEGNIVFRKQYCISEDPMKIAKDVKKITNNLKVNLKNI